jgi:lipopolysaccharide export system permease protein
MRILDRYILRSVVAIFISCVFTFVFLYIIIDILANLELILKQQLPHMILLEYYLSYLPIMFVQVSPFACLLATVYTFGRLNHENEIIAMRSSGLSIFGITKTVIIFGILISILVFWIGDRFVPHALSRTQKIRAQMIESAKKAPEKKQEIINNLAVYGLKNRLFFFNKFNLLTNTIEGVTILEHDQHQNITKKIVANKGVYQDSLWRFSQCITYNFDKNGQIIEEPLYMEEEIMNISETPRDFTDQQQQTKFMTIAQLDDYIWKLSKSGATTVIRNLKVDLYQRFTSAFTSIVIIILGIPFSMMVKKRASGLSSIGISIIVAFFYYILDAVCIALGRGGWIMPSLAASLSHIMALSAGIYLIRKLP